MIWQTAKFASLVAGMKNAIVGGPFGSKLVSKDYTQEGVPVIRGVNMSNGRYISEADFVFVSDEKKRKDLQSNLARPGDMVFTQRGTLGQVAIVPDDSIYREFVISQSQMRATLDPAKADKHFYYYFFSSKNVIDTIMNMTSSSGVPHINLGTLKDFEVPVPPLPTQQRIAGILSAYDDLIKNNRRRIGLLEQAARLLYRDWFVHFRFPGHETAKIVDGLPEGWNRCIVEDLLLLQRGFDLPVGDRRDGDVPVYGSTGIVGYHNEPKVPAPAIVTGRSGSLGQVTISDTPCWPLNTALWVKELKRIPPSLAYYLLVSLELGKYNGGASVPTLDRKVVHRLPAIRPAPDVADQFDAIVSKSFQTIAKLRTHNLQLIRARDLLLPRLMDGRIPV